MDRPGSTPRRARYASAATPAALLLLLPRFRQVSVARAGAGVAPGAAVGVATRGVGVASGHWKPDRGGIHAITPVVGWGGPWRCKGDPPPLGNTATGGAAIVDRLAPAGAAGAAGGSGDGGGGGGRRWSAAAACACSPCLPGGGATYGCSHGCWQRTCLITGGGGPRGAASITGGLRAGALLVLPCGPGDRGSRIGG